MFGAQRLGALHECVGLLQFRPGELLAQQLLALIAPEGVAVDDAAHALGGERVGVVLALDEDETAVAAVAGVGIEYCMGGGTRTCEGVEH